MQKNLHRASKGYKRMISMAVQQKRFKTPPDPLQPKGKTARTIVRLSKASTKPAVSIPEEELGKTAAQTWSASLEKGKDALYM